MLFPYWGNPLDGLEYGSRPQLKALRALLKKGGKIFQNSTNDLWINLTGIATLFAGLANTPSGRDRIAFKYKFFITKHKTLRKVMNGNIWQCFRSLIMFSLILHCTNNFCRSCESTEIGVVCICFFSWFTVEVNLTEMSLNTEAIRVV